MKAASERGRINSDEFVTMFQEMATRPEIYFLLIRFANRDYFTAEDFRHFLECEQAVSINSHFSFFLNLFSTLSDLNAQMSDVTLEKCCQFIEMYEPSSEARLNNQLLLDGMFIVSMNSFK